MISQAAGGGEDGRGRRRRRGARPGAVVPGAVAEPVAAQADCARPATPKTFYRWGCGPSSKSPSLGFGPLIVALEDDYGRGAAVGCCWRLDDGRIAVDGWTTPDWDSAILHVERLHVMRPVTELYVGASSVGPGAEGRPVGAPPRRHDRSPGRAGRLP